MLAGAAMAMSSVSVVTSSLMLKKWQRPAIITQPQHQSLSRNNGGGTHSGSSHFLSEAFDSIKDTFDKLRGKAPRTHGYLAATRRNGSVEAFPLMSAPTVGLAARNDEMV